jgi:hypothetical protein
MHTYRPDGSIKHPVQFIGTLIVPLNSPVSTLNTKILPFEEVINI